jgi:hypothetical protein
LSSPVIQGRSYQIPQLITDDLLVIQRHTFGVLGLKFGGHAFSRLLI